MSSSQPYYFMIGCPLFSVSWISSRDFIPVQANVQIYFFPFNEPIKILYILLYIMHLFSNQSILELLVLCMLLPLCKCIFRLKTWSYMTGWEGIWIYNFHRYRAPIVHENCVFFFFTLPKLVMHRCFSKPCISKCC